ncbi:CACB1 protein, partial [Menura novaehollandiae]|nr:CACB1 protein [Menura novaehollandiae]
QGSAESYTSRPSDSDVSLEEDREALRKEAERQAMAQLEKAKVGQLGWNPPAHPVTPLAPPAPHPRHSPSSGVTAPGSRGGTGKAVGSPGWKWEPGFSPWLSVHHTVGPGQLANECLVSSWPGLWPLASQGSGEELHHPRCPAGGTGTCLAWRGGPPRLQHPQKPRSRPRGGEAERAPCVPPSGPGDARLCPQAEHVPPYDVVPSMRPIILVGPSLKGYEVTDMMQKALFDFLKHRFDGRISITRVTADISLAKRSVLNNPSKHTIIERSSTRSSLGTDPRAPPGPRDPPKPPSVSAPSPSRGARSTLYPGAPPCPVGSTVSHCPHLVPQAPPHTQVPRPAPRPTRSLPQEMFDIVLDENQLEEACEHLAEYLEAYWKATHPPSSNPPNPLLNRTMATAALAASPAPVSNLQVQVLTSLRRNLNLWGREATPSPPGPLEEHAL